MPRDDRRQLAAARTNTLLLRYTALLGIFVIALVIEIIGVYVVMNIGKTQNEQTISENNAKASSYAIINQEAQTFRANLATSKFVLAKQVPYTTLILSLAHSLPSGSSIGNLNINPETFGTPTTLTVTTQSYESAIRVKTALQNANVNGMPLFTSVSFQSVNSDDSGKSTAVFDITYSKAVLAQ